MHSYLVFRHRAWGWIGFGLGICIVLLVPVLAGGWSWAPLLGGSVVIWAGLAWAMGSDPVVFWAPFTSRPIVFGGVDNLVNLRRGLVLAEHWQARGYWRFLWALVRNQSRWDEWLAVSHRFLTERRQLGEYYDEPTPGVRTSIMLTEVEWLTETWAAAVLRHNRNTARAALLQYEKVQK